MSRSRQVLDLLRDYESRNVTFVDPDGCWPIVWESASGVHVRDVDGRRYLDLTAAFGVAAAGHANPRVTQAARRQMTRLLHAMGDVHPHELKARLARELSRITFERWSGPKNRIRGKTIFCNSGFEAVEAALKTAMLATGKPGVIAFEGAYHGLGYGALNATHRAHFRGPFEPQLGRFGHFVTFPPLDRPDSLGALESTLAKLFRRRAIGAILVEVVQARGGINVPPAGFLPLLRHVCDRSGALLIVDEIYTGFGRTGAWFACEHYNVMPDMVCLGKALTGGFPLSACVGRADLMDAAWPAATGEAIHTSTFLGHPVGCAMALEQIAEIRRLELVNRSAALGKVLLRELERVASNVSGYEVGARGLGLMAGLELRDRSGKPATDAAIKLMKAMLRRGFILLPEGEHSNVISFTPPLTIPERGLVQAVRALEQELEKLARPSRTSKRVEEKIGRAA